MNVQDVDPEPVPLLKGPFAEGAGELPVSLVHARGVLEVLISVIPVGEHFPTPVTSVTLRRLCQTRGGGGGGGLWSATFLHSYFLPGNFKKLFITGNLKYILKSKS